MKPTIESLQRELKTARELCDQLRSDCSLSRTSRDEWKRKSEETHKQFDELKTRLLAAERANEFMRGYLSRIREDDLVKEPLIEVGDRERGETHLVPKRKPTAMPHSDDFSKPPSDPFRDMEYGETPSSRQRKHWVTY